MKKITDKQIACINKCKHVIDDNKYGNELDSIDITKLTCYDASKLIGGLLVLIKCDRLIGYGYGPLRVSESSMYLKALDDVYDTIEKYQQQA